MWLEIPHPSIVGISHVCTHLVDLMGVHLLNCVHGNEQMGTHDVVCDTFVAIVQNVGFHVGREQLYALPLIMFNFFRHHQINIVLTKDGIHTLTNIVIVHPTRVDLFP
jgi:hypothetical protein